MKTRIVEKEDTDLDKGIGHSKGQVYREGKKYRLRKKYKRVC